MSSFKRKMATTNLAVLKVWYKVAKKEYYNSEKGISNLTDAEFDALEVEIRKQDPKWSGLKKTGVKVGKKTKITLAVPMPSLDKIQADNPEALERWKRKHCVGKAFRASEKLDGASVQAEYKATGKDTQVKLVKLATRGDGETGKDISHFIPHVNLPQTLTCRLPHLVIRMEAVIPQKVYLKKWAKEYDSARALASSLTNRQDVAPALADLEFVSLRLLNHNVSVSAGLNILTKLGFRVARGELVETKKATAEHLTKLLKKSKASSRYETDGLVLFSDEANLETTNERPEYARAFKLNDSANAQPTKVLDIEWNISRYGVIVPKAIIEPVKFGNVTVKQVALHNIKWAVERGLGIGATATVLRSGDIIPKFHEVLKEKKLVLPSKKDVGDYKYDESGTHLVLVKDKGNKGNTQVAIQKMTEFFQRLDLVGMSEALAEKLVNAGVTDTMRVPRLTAKDFAKLPGVKGNAVKYEAQCKRILTGEFDITLLMTASGVFEKGVGNTRLKTLQVTHPNLLTVKVISLGKQNVLDLITNTPGCGPAFARLYVQGLPAFLHWMERSGAKVAAVKKVKVVKGLLTGINFSWTGYRNAEEEAWVTRKGGQVIKFGSKTSVLFYKDDGKASGKTAKAKASGILIAEFPTYKRLTEK